MRPVQLAYIASIFLGSFLLFAVQPLVTRMLLPAFGGSPAVWTTALVFFQTLLLGGYLYAHGLARGVPARVRPALHTLVLLAPLPLLPPALAWDPDPFGSPWPAATLLAALTALVGVPFFVLSTNSSLVQHWWARSRFPRAADPYWLYSASNAGSLLALLSYPFLVEPALGLRDQARYWAAGYVAFLGLTLTAMVHALRQERAARRREAAAGAPPAGAAHPRVAVAREAEDAPATLRRGLWVVRAAVGSSLLLSLSLRITTDVAPVPLLWVVPLAVYLGTWIVAYGFTGRIRRGAVAGSAALGIAASLGILLAPVTFSFGLELSAGLWTLFFGALLCHHDLASDRPATRHLTGYYLWIAFGGALGGILNALVAPVVFDSVAEYPLTLVALAVLLHASPGAPRLLEAHRLHWRTGALVAAALAAPLAASAGGSVTVFALVAGGAALGAVALSRYAWGFAALVLTTGLVMLVGLAEPPSVVARERSFFGVLRVRQGPEHVELLHGTTVHGTQSRDPSLRRVPGSYYHPTGPLGAAVRDQGPGARIGVIGLGTGALATLTDPGQEIVFHEIDPSVVRVARAHFTYLEDAPGQVRTVLGDGRVTLEGVPEGAYDLLIVDAFSSGFVPVHLLTVEAMDLYLSRVAPEGLVLLHLSNRHADLGRVARGYAESTGRPVAFARYEPSAAARAEGAHGAVVAALSPDPGVIGALARGPGWTRLELGVRPVVWTDDRSDLLRVLR